jgi:hypothetical protein
VATLYGTAEVVTGRLAGVPVLHVPRHGAGHARLSNQLTPRATVAAMAALGASALVSTTVCGAVDPSLELGSLVVFDDLHFPANRLADGSLCTLFTTPEIPGRGHWIYDRPSASGCARAGRGRGGGGAGGARRRRLRTRGRAAPELRGRDRPARGRGGDLRQPDGRPETVLAGEARLPFALMGFVTDHANGVSAVPTPHETLARLFSESAGVFQRVLRAALPRIAADPGEAPGILFAL